MSTSRVDISRQFVKILFPWGRFPPNIGKINEKFCHVFLGMIRSRKQYLHHKLNYFLMLENRRVAGVAKLLVCGCGGD